MSKTPERRCYHPGCDRLATRRVQLVEPGGRNPKDGSVVMVWVCHTHRMQANRNLAKGLPTFNYMRGKNMWPEERLQQLYDLHDQGWSLREIAKEMEVGHMTVKRKLADRKK